MLHRYNDLNNDELRKYGEERKICIIYTCVLSKNIPGGITIIFIYNISKGKVKVTDVLLER